MLSGEQIIAKLKKRIDATLQQIGDNMITGGVDSMEKYKYLLGQAQAYQIISQEISNLLKEDEKEPNDGNVIDIKGSTKTKLALQEKYDQEKKEQSHAKRLDENNIKEVENQLPEPVGYRILVLPFTPKEKTKGGILFSQEQLDKARIATTCGYVLKMGDLAYKDKDKFNEPWCKIGDWVMFARYAGARLPIEGGEVRILNDDEVLGTIKDPESVLHYI